MKTKRPGHCPPVRGTTQRPQGTSRGLPTRQRFPALGSLASSITAPHHQEPPSVGPVLSSLCAESRGAGAGQRSAPGSPCFYSCWSQRPPAAHGTRAGLILEALLGKGSPSHQPPKLSSAGPLPISPTSSTVVLSCLAVAGETPQSHRAERAPSRESLLPAARRVHSSGAPSELLCREEQAEKVTEGSRAAARLGSAG